MLRSKAIGQARRSCSCRAPGEPSVLLDYFEQVSRPLRVTCAVCRYGGRRGNVGRSPVPGRLDGHRPFQLFSWTPIGDRLDSANSWRNISCWMRPKSCLRRINRAPALFLEKHHDAHTDVNCAILLGPIKSPCCWFRPLTTAAHRAEEFAPVGDF
jgi:hypothetical protein